MSCLLIELLSLPAVQLAADGLVNAVSGTGEPQAENQHDGEALPDSKGDSDPSTDDEEGGCNQEHNQRQAESLG